MRVALVTPYHPSAILGGQERVVSDLAKGLAKNGHSAEIVSLTAEESVRWSRFGHLPALHLLSSKLGNLDSFDLIHANGWVSQAFLGKKGLPPLLVTMHGTIAQYLQNVRLSPFMRAYSELTQMRYEQDACDRAAHLSALSERQVAEMREHYGCAKNKVRKVSCGIDTALFSPKRKGLARRRLGLPEGKKIVLACARWDIAHKGFDILLKLAEKLGDDGLVIANGKVPPGLDRMLKPNMRARTTALSDMPYLYSAADVFVHPSRYEGFGLVTAEAMACGTPAVAFDTGAAAELIGKDEAGMLVRDIADEGEFIEKSIGLLGDGEKARGMGEKTRGRVSKFSVEKMVGNYFDYYREIIRKG